MRKTKAYKSLPYNPALRIRAKALRKAGLLHEALLWLELKNKKLNGLDFDVKKSLVTTLSIFTARKNPR